MKKTLLRSGQFVFAVVVGLTTLPRAGHAFEADVERCYSTAPLWNAKKGVIVSGVNTGPVQVVLNAVGETRTHSMISNGDWATHSTSLTPSVKYVDVFVLGVKVGSVPDINQPLKASELAAGSPGFTQINMGGAYAYWRHASQTWTQVNPPTTLPSVDPSQCTTRCKTQGTADWLWSSIPYQASGTIFYLGWLDRGGALHRLTYGLHQYMDGIERITEGSETEDPGGRGIVCSQVPPYSYVHWVNETHPNIAAGTEAMNYQTYSHAETQNAGSKLWHAIYDACMGDDVGFWANLFTGGLASDVQEATCNNAANQVLNCFFEGEIPGKNWCSDISGTPFSNFKKNANAPGAKSLSPEGLMGLNGKPATGPWNRWSQGSLQWNGGGSVYGCYW